MLTSIENNDWRERQVVQHRDNFYILAARNFVQKVKHYKYQYTFKPMHPGEIIRGRIVVIG